MFLKLFGWVIPAAHKIHHLVSLDSGQSVWTAKKGGDAPHLNSGMVTLIHFRAVGNGEPKNRAQRSTKIDDLRHTFG